MIKHTLRKAGTLATTASVAASTSVFGQGIRDGIDAANTGESPTDLNTVIQNVIRILLFVVGVGAVIMLIIGGIRYVVSAGDQSAVANAKNTILYAIVGIVVAVLAWAAVDFVFNLLST